VRGDRRTDSRPVLDPLDRRDRDSFGFGEVGSRLAIWQQRDGFAPFQVADNGPITLVAPPRPVVDPNHHRRNETRADDVDSFCETNDSQRRNFTKSASEPVLNAV
jgi:hypothetical protein